VAKTKPQSARLRIKVKKHFLPQINTIVGWLIYSHSNITAFTSGKGHPDYTSGQIIALILFD